MTIYNGGGYMDQPAVTSMGAAALRLGDRHPPTVSVIDHTAGHEQWTNAERAGVRLIAHDDGLGLKLLGVARTDKGDPNTGPIQDGYWLGLLDNMGCFGTRRSTSPCLRDADTAGAGSFYPDGRLPYFLPTEEGVHTVRASTHQISGGQYGDATHSPTWQVKVDRTAPVLQLSGDLSEPGGGVAETTGQDLFGLEVTATDGVEGGSPLQRRSGVARLTLTVDGTVVSDAQSSASCVDSCALTLPPFEFAYDDYTPGEHTIVVRAVDRLGQPTERTFRPFVPGPDFYQGQVDDWKRQIESRVDAASPLPLSGPMPAPSQAWETAAGCETSTTELGACYDTVRTWIRDTKAWLETNRLPTTDFSSLPSMPVYGWAPEITATHLTIAAAEGFDTLRTSMIGSGIFRTTVSFKSPQNPAQVLALLSLPDLNLNLDRVELRGVYGPGAAAISGGAVMAAPASLSVHLDRFYGEQYTSAIEQLAEMEEDIANPADDEGTVRDEDDLLALREAAEELRGFSTALQAREPFVRGISLDLSAVQVLKLLLDPTATSVLKLSAIPTSPFLGGDDDPGSLDDFPSLAETVSWRAGDRANSSEATVRTAAVARPAYFGNTCKGAGDTGSSHGLASTFMPNNWESKVALSGASRDNGRHNKISHLRMRWVKPRSLAYFWGSGYRCRSLTGAVVRLCSGFAS